MPDKKLTDAAIVKALECFALDKDFDETQCIGCAFEHKFCTANMSVDIAKPALELINRQKAEIERLNNDLRVWKDIAHRNTGYVETAKSEAIKEFAERLRNDFCESCSTHKRYHLEIEQCREKEKENPDRKWCFKMRLIDNLVKEMVGEDNAQN